LQFSTEVALYLGNTITAESDGERKSVNVCGSYGQESKWVFFSEHNVFRPTA